MTQKYSYFIIDIKFREITDFKRVRPNKNSILGCRIKILDPLDNSIRISVWLIKFNPDIVAVAEIHNFSNVFDLTPGPTGQFASGPNGNRGSQFGQILRILLLKVNFLFVLLYELRVVLEELFLPLSEVLW